MLKKEEHLNFYRGRDNAYHDGVTVFWWPFSFKSRIFFASLSEQTVRAFQLPLAVTVENFKRKNSVKVDIKI